MITDASPIDY